MRRPLPQPITDSIVRVLTEHPGISYAEVCGHLPHLKPGTVMVLLGRLTARKRVARTGTRRKYRYAVTA